MGWNKQYTSRFFGSKTVLFSIFAGLCFYSLATLWSVTEGISGPYNVVSSGIPKILFWKQLTWVLIGWFIAVAAYKFPLQLLEETAPVLYLVMFLVLVALLFFAPEVAGARRWFFIGPVSVQPSEFAKIVLILMLARLFSRDGNMGNKVIPVAISFVISGLFVALILNEPDLGTSLVIVAIWVMMVFWYGLSGILLVCVSTPVLSAIFSFYSENVIQQPWPWAAFILLLIGFLYFARFGLLESSLLLFSNILTGIGASFFWDKLKLYQQERILTFFEPGRDMFGAGYQAYQSKVAIGSGGLFGTGFLNGTQKGLAFLPERETDFIFSVVGEELGFVGAMLLITMFLILIISGLNIAKNARKPFSSMLAIGIVAFFGFHVVVNISITSGLLPVTGLPLPFMSYGGSHILVSSLMIGLLANVGSRTFEN
ncbi:MAG: rod shape-determining protein RodA [bacterium]|nr:rod shape-determining protein RodA [bacterium]MCP4799906.1 rod shape-determining protein RodA [bacterium]